jgi:predicted permease
MMRKMVAAILRLFPKRFREQFGEDMLGTFDDRWQEHRSFRLAARTLVDLAASAAIQHGKGDNIMRILWQDTRFAMRTLLKAPGFAVVAVLTLALGIGVNTAMFSVAHAVLWRSLPYADPDRLVAATEAEAKQPDSNFGVSYPNFRDWQAQSSAFENLAGTLHDDRVLREGGEPVRISGASVSASFFNILGVQPEIGRVFTKEEDTRSGPDVMVLSHSLWVKQFAADPAITGRKLRLGARTMTIIGVMPAGLDYPPKAEYWLPLESNIGTHFATHRAVYVMGTIGRLRDGKTAIDAEKELNVIRDRIRRAYPETDRGLVSRVIPLRDQLGRDLKPALLALLGAAGLVLLIACGNLAALMLVRASGRTREFAIRAALGAGRRRLIRQLLTESSLLSIAGGAAGIALAALAMRSLSLLTQDPRLLDIRVERNMLLFAATITIATNILFAVFPAVRATRANAAAAVKQSRTGDPRRARSQQFVVVAEVALCLVLLTGAGLLLESFRRVLNVDPGFQTSHLLTMRVGIPIGYNTPEALARFYRDSTSRLGALPGVRGVSAVSSLPISGGDGVGDIHIEGQPFAEGHAPAASFRSTLPNYFRVMGIPLVRGREFDERDDATHPNVTIINESMARRFWPDGDAIGARIQIGPVNTPERARTVIGVVKDVRQEGLDRDAHFSVYDPLPQSPWGTVSFAVRAEGDPRSIMASVRAELHAMEPQMVVDRVETMSDRIGNSVAPRRLNLTLFGLFAALALLLASVGLYGVVAYSAGQRTQEFGIRMALGAQTGDVLRMVLGQGLKLALAGVAIGIAAALVVARVLTTLLFGVRPYDPVTIASVALVVTLVALAACWLPARRATRIAPITALRCE